MAMEPTPRGDRNGVCNRLFGWLPKAKTSFLFVTNVFRVGKTRFEACHVFNPERMNRLNASPHSPTLYPRTPHEA
jgi:hypothetical protein